MWARASCLPTDSHRCTGGHHCSDVGAAGTCQICGNASLNHLPPDHTEHHSVLLFSVVCFVLGATLLSHKCHPRLQQMPIHTMDQLDQRLRRLEFIFGNKITFEEPPESSPNETMPKQTRAKDADPACPQGSVQEGLSSPRAPITNASPPRARSRGPFDCSRFRINEPTDDDVAFCPWKMVEIYPNNFVGNANRPHVRDKLHDPEHTADASSGSNNV